MRAPMVGYKDCTNLVVSVNSSGAAGRRVLTVRLPLPMIRSGLR